MKKWRPDRKPKDVTLRPEEREKGLQELEEHLNQGNRDFIVYVENLCRFRMVRGHSEDSSEYEQKINKIVDGFDIVHNPKTRKNEIVFPEPFKRAKDYILALKKEDLCDFNKIIEIVGEIRCTS